MFSEDVFARWSAESVFAYCKEKELDDITLDDVVRMLDNTPEPPVGWIVFYNENNIVVDDKIAGPYWTEQDIEEDMKIYRDDDGLNVERTLAIADSEMCEWLDNLISRFRVQKN